MEANGNEEKKATIDRESTMEDAGNEKIWLGMKKRIGGKVSVMNLPRIGLKSEKSGKKWRMR